MPQPLPPPTLAAELHRLTEQELALPARLRYLGLLLAASAMTAVNAALLITETGLPLRTIVALALMTAIGAAWMAFAAWVLARKRPFMGRHRIVAARLSVTFCGVFTVGALSIGLARSASAGYAAAAMGAVMTTVAIAGLSRATHRVAALSKRRDELTRRIP